MGHWDVSATVSQTGSDWIKSMDLEQESKYTD